MNLSSEPSQDEDQTMQRQLYRAGQTQSASVAAPRPVPTEGEANPPSRRKRRVRLALAVIAWLLLLGGISYYLFLPDLDEVSRSLKAIREDPNLTMQQKFEKSREIFAKLTPEQGKQVVQSDMRKMHYHKNAEMRKFLKMTPEEQVAYMKKQREERKGFPPPGGPLWASDPKVGGGPVTVKGGGAGMPIGSARVMMGDGPGGGLYIFFGPGPGGPGGGPPNPAQMQKNMLDNTSPETRAGMFYQRGLLK